VAGRTDFTADEWLTMRRAMMGAAVLVSVSDGGKNDMISEMLAVSEQLMGARTGHPNQLIRELADIKHFQSGFRLGMSLGQLEQGALQAMRTAAATVSAKAPDDMPAFQTFLVELAETAANAHREGGFLGVGASRVSLAEAAAIDKVKQALTVPPPAPR